MHLLAQFIRDNEAEIVGRWLLQVSRLPSAAGQSRVVLIDHIPEILDQIAETLDTRDGGGELGGDELDEESHKLALRHARDRLRAGFDLQQVVAEYRTLRQTILALFRERGPISDESRPRLQPLAHLNEVIDVAIADSVERYATERDRARDTFVSILGHDLRNPLNAIAMSASLLLRRSDALDEQTLRVATQITNSARRMEAIISDVLDFARGRLGSGIPVTREPCDLRGIVRSTVAELAAAHPDRTIRCHAASAPGDFRGLWDAGRIAQAISNLVGNAVTHGQDPIDVVPYDRGDSVRLEIRNGGVIPPDVVPRLFDPFTTRTAAGARASSGLGLGLYIVQEIATAHGGSVAVDTAEERGTTIAMQLPKS